MDTHTEKFKVRLGLFILVGLSLFVLAIFIIGKQQNLFNPVFKLTTNFYNVAGLQVGNNVRFTGINVGIVDNIKIINDSTVKVDMLIRRDVQQFIKNDCEVAVGSEGLIGDRLLIITYGSPGAPVVKDGQYVKSKEPIETDAIIRSLKVTADNIEVITNELADVMYKVNSGYGTLGRLIYDSSLALNINQIVLNLKNSSVGLDNTVDAVMVGVADVVQSVKKTTDNAEYFSASLKEVMDKINDDKGTFSLLVQDTNVSGNFSETILNLKNSSKGLDENMEALKHNFLFRGYFRRKAKEDAEKQRLLDNEMKK